jgi:ectoine hydroxylase-related dioxygenase (phytanoyl-CoA dioxygenase family)
MKKIISPHNASELFMEQMRDSTHLIGDSQALCQEIHAEGYVLLRGLVDPEEAAAVGAEVRVIMANHRYTSYGHGVETVLKTPVKGNETNDYWRMYSDVLGLESVNSLPHRSERLQGTVRGLLGESAFTYPMKTVRLVFPQASGGAAIPLHRDNRGGPWVKDMLTTWVALGEIDYVMGGFAILRNSHTYRYQAVYEDREPPQDVRGEPVPDLDSPEWVSTEWRPGDVVLFHCYALHRGLYNRSSCVRVSVDYRWQATDHPVYVGALLPYHYLDKYPHIPDWDTLSAHWSDQRWNGFPADAEITYEKWPVSNGNRIPESKLVEVVAGAEEAWRPSIRDEQAYEVPYATPVPH